MTVAVVSPVRVGADEVVAGSFRGRIGRARVVRCFLGKRSIGAKAAEILIGRDMKKAIALRLIPAICLDVAGGIKQG